MLSSTLAITKFISRSIFQSRELTSDKYYEMFFKPVLCLIQTGMSSWTGPDDKKQRLGYRLSRFRRKGWLNPVWIRRRQINCMVEYLFFLIRRLGRVDEVIMVFPLCPSNSKLKWVLMGSLWISSVLFYLMSPPSPSKLIFAPSAPVASIVLPQLCEAVLSLHNATLSILFRCVHYILWIASIKG